MANNDYITTDCKLTVSKNTAKLDEEIFLYKNDRNIKLLIEIVDNKYRYKSDDLSNLLVKYKASYAQVKWYKNAEVKKEFPIQATDDGKVVFVIEGQLIDEDTELGDYDLQLRLLNESQESIRSLPIIKGAVHILKPLFEEGDIATVNSAVADVSMLSLDGAPIDTYNSDGTYNQTNWGNGDVISSAKLNKLEKVAKDNVDKVNKIPAKSIVEGGKLYLAKADGTKLDSGTELPAGGTGTSYDDTEIKTDINTIKTDLGTAQLTTTNKDIKGAINEVNAQYKDIANELGRDSEGNPINMGTTATNIRSAIKELKDNQGNSEGGSSYTLPIATPTTLGGVKPITKTDKMTQEVGVDAEGKLYTCPIASGDSGKTEDVLKGTLPYTVNENGLYLLSDKNVTISTGNGAEDKVNFNDSSTIECKIDGYPNYCGNESYTIIGNNSVSLEQTIADKNCALYFTLKNLKPNTTYTMVGKIFNDAVNSYVRINSLYQIKFDQANIYYFKSFTTNENEVSVKGMIAFNADDVGSIKQYELHIFEGELAEMPSGTSFDITSNTKYNLDGYIGSTLTCTTTDATVNVYKNESVESEKGIIIFGDSIFDLSTVASKLSKLIGKSVLDCAVGGARLTCTRDSSNEFYPYDMTQIADAIESGDYSTQIAKGKNQNFTTLSTANINNYGTIILEFGTNDFTSKASFSGTEKTTVEGALKYILTKIQTKYPKLRIVVLSTMQFVAIGSGSESGVPTHDDGTVWQMNEVIKNVCESDAYCIPFIDMYHKMQQNVTTRSTVTRDGVHLMSPTGEERYANLLNGQLKALGI